MHYKEKNKQQFKAMQMKGRRKQMAIKYDLSRERKQVFYNSEDWQSLRKYTLRTYENKCMKCGLTESLCIDHIKPISNYPWKSLDYKNLQILCYKCNKKKSDLNTQNYRAFTPDAGKIIKSLKGKWVEYFPLNSNNTTDNSP